MFETLTITLREGIEVAYDACALCGAAGYVQEGDELICKRCEAPINRDSLDLGGGCNPIPLNFTLEGEQIVIKTEYIGEKADLFKN